MNNDKLYIKVLCVIIPIILAITFLYSVIRKNKIFLIMSSVSIAAFSAAYPIADEVHFLIGILPTGLIIFYILDICIKTIIKLINKILNKIYKNISIHGKENINKNIQFNETEIKLENEAKKCEEKEYEKEKEK